MERPCQKKGKRRRGRRRSRKRCGEGRRRNRRRERKRKRKERERAKTTTKKPTQAYKETKFGSIRGFSLVGECLTSMHKALISTGRKEGKDGGRETKGRGGVTWLFWAYF